MIELNQLLFLTFLLILFSVLSVSLISRKYRFLLVFFFPSWKFFDRAESEPIVSYCVNNGDWKNIDWKVRRRFFHLFINPEGNLRLYFYSQVEKLLFELSQKDEVKDFSLQKLHTYQKICELLGLRLFNIYPDLNYFQFRISFEDHKKIDQETPAFISPPVEVLR